MMRRDVLTGRDGATTTDPNHAGTWITDMHIELEPTDHEEPTYELRQPGGPKRRRLDRRTRSILIIAAIAAIVANAGAAWAYWRITGSETAEAGAGAVSMALRARSDLNKPLRAGETGNLTVTVTNDYEFPIRITSVTPGSGNIVADAEHRDAGCKDAAVDMTQKRFAVTWDVRRNTLGAFTVTGGLTLRPDADPACAGATFTVPVQAFGVRRDVS